MVALLIWAILVAPQNSKLASLQTQETTLQSQESGLQVQAGLAEDRAAEAVEQLCRPAEDRHPDPERAEPDGHRCRGVVVREPVQCADRLVPGVTLTQFSGFTPATTTSTSSGVDLGSPSGDQRRASRCRPHLRSTGSYSQMTAFVNGLDSFPRLFVIQTFVLAFGADAATAGSRPVERRQFVLRCADRRHSAVGRRNADRGHGRSVQPGHHRVDLLHLDPERPGRLHQGHGGGQVVRHWGSGSRPGPGRQLSGTAGRRR